VRPLGRYVRARLHRRIFLWFGASILLTGVAVAFVMILAGRAGPSWYAREVVRVRALTSHLFARVWDVPAERDALARSIADDLDVSVILSGADRRPIATFGPPCRSSVATAAVVRDGITLGHIDACAGPERAGSGGRGGFWLITPLVLLGGALWAASGAIARRISRPLGDLARVAQEIGSGNLASRVRLDCQLHGEVGVVGEAINDMAARIERQMADQRELLAAVSHELRTPLARLRLLTEIARDAGVTEKTLDEVDREVMEIDALVGDLLASSRIDFAAMTLHALGAEEAARRALERAGEGQGGEKLEIASPSVRIEADATLLGRALANLIDNAKKHGGGVLCMRVVRRGDRAAFEVDDAGEGFLEGEEDRVFEPFYHRGEGGREAGSLGLGLALVKRIAEAHRGRVYAINRPGGGARVGIELPAISDP
jgi:signal transduction histidine kinase